MLPEALWLLDLPEDKPRGIELFLEAEERLRLRLCPVQMPFTKNTEVAVADYLLQLEHEFSKIASHNLISVMRASTIPHVSVLCGKSKEYFT